MRGLTSDLDFIKYTQVALVASSTIVKKYLKPSKVGVEYGPQTSIWSKSKVELLRLLLKGKGKRFFLAKGQIPQVLLQEFCRK